MSTQCVGVSISTARYPSNVRSTAPALRATKEELSSVSVLRAQFTAITEGFQTTGLPFSLWYANCNYLIRNHGVAASIEPLAPRRSSMLVS